jgi:hypothetical protein
MLPAGSRFAFLSQPFCRMNPPSAAGPSRVTQQRVTFCANLPRLSEEGGDVNPKGIPFCTLQRKLVDSRPEKAMAPPTVLRLRSQVAARPAEPPDSFAQRKLSKHRERPPNNQRAQGTQLLQKTTCSSLGLGSGGALRSRPSHRDQTLGLRSAHPLSRELRTFEPVERPSRSQSHLIKPPVAPEPLNPCQGAKLALHSH